MKKKQKMMSSVYSNIILHNLLMYFVWESDRNFEFKYKRKFIKNNYSIYNELFC